MEQPSVLFVPAELFFNGFQKAASLYGVLLAMAGESNTLETTHGELASMLGKTNWWIKQRLKELQAHGYIDLTYTPNGIQITLLIYPQR